jgi:cobalt-zinc-cadmium efflux system outer membrane protein
MTRVRTPVAMAVALAWSFVVLHAQVPARAPDAPLTWPEIRARCETNNLTVQAGRLGIEEARASEVTANLRPNPQVSLSVDQFRIVGNATDPFQNLTIVASINYLHERQGKRELRLSSAKGTTAIAESTQADLLRNLRYSLRGAFVQTLQAKAFQALAHDNLADYDQVLTVGRARLEAGDIAQVDLDRLQLQRVQYEADVETAAINLRTAKIQLLQLLNDATPVDQIDVTGTYDFAEPTQTLAAIRQAALDTRPDLKAAAQALDKATIDHRLAVANGSVDPTVGLDVGHAVPPEALSFNPPLSTWFGVSGSVPLRLFDQNQGEKARTAVDINRNQRLVDAARLQVLSDVDSAFASVMSTVALLRPYKAVYLPLAARVRETVTSSYQRGGASLLEFLQAEQDDRSVRVTYVNLTAAFLNAVNQLNLAVGREVIQ